MKNFKLLALVLGLTLVLAGCGTKAQTGETTETTPPATTETTETAENQGTTNTEEAQKPAEGEVQFAGGTILDVGMSAVTILDENGDELSFNLDGAKVTENLQVGDSVVVHYYGDIDATHPSTDCQVESVELMDYDSKYDNASYVTGTVSEASMHQFTLTDEKGSEYHFLIDDNTVNLLTNGLVEGETIIACYDSTTEQDVNTYTLIEMGDAE